MIASRHPQLPGSIGPDPALSAAQETDACPVMVNIFTIVHEIRPSACVKEDTLFFSV